MTGTGAAALPARSIRLGLDILDSNLAVTIFVIGILLSICSKNFLVLSLGLLL